MAEENNKRGNGGTLQDLIRVTEERTRAEERVRAILSRIADDQEQVSGGLATLSKQVAMLSNCIAGLQQMIAIIVEYMAVLAGRDQAEVREIRERLLDKLTDTSGIAFGDSASVGIGGDMVGGDKEKGEG